MPAACRLSLRPRGGFGRREAPDRLAKLLGLVAGLCFDGWTVVVALGLPFTPPAVHAAHAAA